MLDIGNFIHLSNCIATTALIAVLYDTPTVYH